MNEKINLKELTHLLAEKSGIQKRDAEAFLKVSFDTIDKALFDDLLVKVKNLGSFKLISVNDRESIDVLTKKRVLIPAHYKVTYSPDSDLAQTVNEPFSLFETVEINDDDVKENDISDDTCGIEEITHKEIDVVSGNKEEEIEQKQFRTETAPVSKQPIYKERKKNSISNRIFIFCCIIVFLLGIGIFYCFDREDAYLSRQVPSPDFVAGSDNAVENSANGIIEDIVSDESEDTKKDVFSEKIEVPVSAVPMISETNAASGKTRTIQSGERLTLVALEEYGDKSFWIYIYEENKSIIKNPNSVPSGLTIVIPLASKYGIDKNDGESIKKAKVLASQYKK